MAKIKKKQRRKSKYNTPKFTGLQRAKRATGNRLDELLDKADGRLKTDYGKTTDAAELKRENLRLRRIIRKREEQISEWKTKLAEERSIEWKVKIVEDRTKMAQELELYKELLEDKHNGEQQ